MDNSSGATTPEVVDDGADKILRDTIATYTGFSPAEMARDADIGELGVDSIATVELAEELQTQFRKEIAAEDLLANSYGALSELLVPFSSTKKAPLPSSNNFQPQAGIPTSPPSASFSFPTVDASPQKSQSHQVALKLLSDTSGAPIASINNKNTLLELGIDSLFVCWWY